MTANTTNGYATTSENLYSTVLHIFSGHLAYYGKQLNAKRVFDAKQYECAIRMMRVLALVRRGGMK